jgi:hypothetical protein
MGERRPELILGGAAMKVTIKCPDNTDPAAAAEMVADAIRDLAALGHDPGNGVRFDAQFPTTDQYLAAGWWKVERP